MTSATLETTSIRTAGRIALLSPLLIFIQLTFTTVALLVYCSIFACEICPFQSHSISVYSCEWCHVWHIFLHQIRGQLSILITCNICLVLSITSCCIYLLKSHAAFFLSNQRLDSLLLNHMIHLSILLNHIIGRWCVLEEIYIGHGTNRGPPSPCNLSIVAPNNLPVMESFPPSWISVLIFSNCCHRYGSVSPKPWKDVGA